jgi:Fe2+ or Zn2+ uptake regulation protein
MPRNDTGGINCRKYLDISFLFYYNENDNHYHEDDFIDEEIELLKKTEKGLSKKYNFKITDHLMQFYGLCSRCQKQ